MTARRTRIGRLRAAVAAAASVKAVPKEVWLPAKGGGDPPGRYPQPGGRVVIVLYAPDEAEPPGGAR